MKKILLATSLLSVLGSSGIKAQDNGSDFVSDKKGALIGFAIDLWEFNTEPKLKDLQLGGSLMYWQGLHKKIDLSIRYNGLFTQYMKEVPNNSLSKYNQELEASLHLRAMNDDRLLNPFLTAGVGAGYYNTGIDEKNFIPYVPVGLGLQVNFFSESYVFLQANYRIPFSDYLDNHLFYSLGFAQAISYGKPKEPKVPPPPPDGDGDGVADDVDKCPTVAGPASLEGCPDADGDGIADMNDKCPNERGVAKYNGCPVPDSDGDGVNDEMDKCPNERGVAKYDGCPVPDSDGDGVNDEEDRCPTVAGSASNRGCPEVREEVKKRLSFAATAIQFETGKAVLTKKSYPVLDEVVAIMNEYKDYDMYINGHTDNTGKPEKNQVLSEERAASVKQYLISKGISESRLHSQGFGDTQPVADNKTAAGRAKNRRVDMDLKLRD